MRGYEVLEGRSPDEIAEKVNDKLSRGYHVCGGVYIADAITDTQGGSITVTLFFQAVVYPFDG